MMQARCSVIRRGCKASGERARGQEFDRVVVDMLRRLRVYCAAVLVCLCMQGTAQADARTDFLVKMLATSSQFRVRAQAALALASSPGDDKVAAALVKALRGDDHPAVRAASASALEGAGTQVATALRDALRDEDKTVRAAAKKALEEIERGSPKSTPIVTPLPGDVSRGAVFYVGVGTPATKAATLSPVLLRTLREYVAREIVQISGVRLAPETETPAAAEKQLKSQKMTGYFLDSSITSLEIKPDGSVRAQVSVIVGTYPGRDMRAMLSGAATVSGGSAGDSTRIEAVQAAYSGALRRLPQAMQAGLARAP